MSDINRNIPTTWRWPHVRTDRTWKSEHWLTSHFHVLVFLFLFFQVGLKEGFHRLLTRDGLLRWALNCVGLLDLSVSQHFRRVQRPLLSQCWQDRIVTWCVCGHFLADYIFFFFVLCCVVCLVFCLFVLFCLLVVGCVFFGGVGWMGWWGGGGWTWLMSWPALSVVS